MRQTNAASVIQGRDESLALMFIGSGLIIHALTKTNPASPLNRRKALSMNSPALIEDLFCTPSVLADPYDYYDKLREGSPVYYSGILQGFLITSYEATKSVLMRPEIFSNDPRNSGAAVVGYYVFDPRFKYLYDEAGVIQPVETIAVVDPPAITRYRRLVDAALSATSVRKMDGWITTVVNELIDGFIDNARQAQATCFLI